MCVELRAYLHSAALLSCSHQRENTWRRAAPLFMPMRCRGSLCLCFCGGALTQLAANSAAGFQSTSSSGGGSLIRQAIQMSPAIHFILERRRRCSRREIHQTLNESIGEITSRLDLIYTCRLPLHTQRTHVYESGGRHTKLFKYFTAASVQLDWSTRILMLLIIALVWRYCIIYSLMLSYFQLLKKILHSQNYPSITTHKTCSCTVRFNNYLKFIVRYQN